jgi:hypothetical protein
MVKGTLSCHNEREKLIGFGEWGYSGERTYVEEEGIHEASILSGRVLTRVCFGGICIFAGCVDGLQ